MLPNPVERTITKNKSNLSEKVVLGNQTQVCRPLEGRECGTEASSSDVFYKHGGQEQSSEIKNNKVEFIAFVIT
jgi:hypothetical protein